MNDEDELPEDLPPDEAKKLSGLVPDIVRRAVLTGVTLEVNATVQLKPSGEPGFKARLRQKKKAGPEPGEGPGPGEEDA